MTLLLRNYIFSLKSEGHEAKGHVESVRSGIVKNGNITDHEDDIAPWPSLQRPNFPSGIKLDETAKLTPSGKINLLSS